VIVTVRSFSRLDIRYYYYYYYYTTSTITTATILLYYFYYYYYYYTTSTITTTTTILLSRSLPLPELEVRVAHGLLHQRLQRSLPHEHGGPERPPRRRVPDADDAAQQLVRVVEVAPRDVATPDGDEDEEVLQDLEDPDVEGVQQDEVHGSTESERSEGRGVQPEKDRHVHRVAEELREGRVVLPALDLREGALGQGVEERSDDPDNPHLGIVEGALPEEQAQHKQPHPPRRRRDGVVADVPELTHLPASQGSTTTTVLGTTLGVGLGLGLGVRG
jgi:hypothetical protein